MTDKKMELRAIKELIIHCAEFYGQQITVNQLLMYAEILSDLPYEKVKYGYMKLRLDPRVTRMPLPAQIRAMVIPPENDEAEADEVAGRIIMALSRFGSYNANSAREWIGEWGWLVVEREGGWNNLCLTQIENIPIIRAQMKKSAMATAHRSRAGTLNHAPEIPTGFASVSSILKHAIERNSEKKQITNRDEK